MINYSVKNKIWLNNDKAISPTNKGIFFIRQYRAHISKLSKPGYSCIYLLYSEPVYITKNGKGDLAVMSIIRFYLPRRYSGKSREYSGNESCKVLITYPAADDLKSIAVYIANKHPLWQEGLGQVALKFREERSKNLPLAELAKEQDF